MQQQHHADSHSSADMQRHHYIMLAVNLIASLAIMYLGMFAMIWSWGDFIQNVNFLYMALVMWAPMAAVMLLTMKPMYRDARLNVALHALFALVFIASLAAIRGQLLVGDRQFVRSMIPHHSGAVLMCREARLGDAELRQLCDGIVRTQMQEIEQMKAIGERL